MAQAPSHWRNPVFWLVLLLPLAAVVAGVGMVVVASRSSGNNDLVNDEVRRTGQIQQAAIGPDAAARAAGLSLVLRSQDGVLELFPATGQFDRTRPLRLLLEHPTEARRDLRLELTPSATGWRVVQALPAADHWNLSVTDPDGRWRLKGRLDAGLQAARLAPALPAER